MIIMKHKFYFADNSRTIIPSNTADDICIECRFVNTFYRAPLVGRNQPIFHPAAHSVVGFFLCATHSANC